MLMEKQGSIAFATGGGKGESVKSKEVLPIPLSVVNDILYVRAFYGSR